MTHNVGLFVIAVIWILDSLYSASQMSLPFDFFSSLFDWFVCEKEAVDGRSQSFVPRDTSRGKSPRTNATSCLSPLSLKKSPLFFSLRGKHGYQESSGVKVEMRILTLPRILPPNESKWSLSIVAWTDCFMERSVREKLLSPERGSLDGTSPPLRQPQRGKARPPKKDKIEPHVN